MTDASPHMLRANITSTTTKRENESNSLRATKTKQPPASIQRHTTKPTNVPTKRRKKNTKNTNQPLRRQREQLHVGKVRWCRGHRPSSHHHSFDLHDGGGGFGICVRKNTKGKMEIVCFLLRRISETRS